MKETIEQKEFNIRPIESYINTSIGKLKYKQWFSLTEEQKKSVKILSDDYNNKNYHILKDIKNLGLKQTLIIYLNDGYSLVCAEDNKLKAVRDGKIICCKANELKENDFLLRSYKKDFCFLPSNRKNNNIDYWYLLGCILNGVVYFTKKDLLACRITNKDNDILHKIKSILKERSIKFFSKNHTICFDVSSFSNEIKALNIRVNRLASFNISLFDSGLFTFNDEITENNIKSFLTSFLDFGRVEVYKKSTVKPKIRLSFRCDKLARELQSLFDAIGIPSNLEQTFCSRKCYLSEEAIINENLSTNIYFTSLMAIQNLLNFDITNTEIKNHIEQKIKSFYKSNLWNQDIPNFNKDGVINIDENLQKYCIKNNIQPNKTQKALINTKIFHTTYLELFRQKGIENFDDDVLDYIYENQSLKTKILKIIKGDVVECCGLVIRGNASNITNVNDSIITFS